MRAAARALLVVSAVLSGGALAAQTEPQPRTGDPVPGLSVEELALFEAGRALFELPLEVSEGLGPIFNQTSCAGCHSLGGSGGAGTITVTRFGVAGAMGDPFDPLEQLGGSLLQSQAISDDCLETIPAVANVIVARITPPIFGAGLVEAIPDADILALEGNGGMAHLVATLEDPGGPERVGRFGWKGQVATVLSFSGDASRNEMGLTNRLLGAENAPNGDLDLLLDCDGVADPEDGPDPEGYDFIDRLTHFQRFLAPPPQTPRSGTAGEAIFDGIGCGDCHHREFVTGAAPEAALSGIPIRPYSDFLLHAMGALGDGIVEGDAAEAMMHTAPLWGLRLRSSLLHDGRVAGGTFAERIVAAVGFHDGEAAPAAAAFATLNDDTRTQLVAFLDSLGRREFDHDGDNVVDEDDFVAFLECFLSGMAVGPDTGCALSDIDQDGDVDGDDFDSFLLVYEGELADCNGNGQIDLVDLVAGTSSDANGNGIPDECESFSLHVVWCAEGGGGSVDSCAALTSSLDALAEVHVVVDDLTSATSEAILADLGTTDIVWVMLGTWPDNHPLTPAEGQILADLAPQGVAIHIEGCDVWGFDPPTPFASHDGVEDGTVIDGDDTFDAMTGLAFGSLDLSDLAGLPYQQDQVASDYTDRILPTGTTAGQPVDVGGANAGNVWVNDPDGGESAYPVATFYEPDPPHGRVLAQSWELGGFGGDLPVLVQLYSDALRLPGESRFERGDCNGDLSVALADAIFLLSFLFVSGASPPCDDACDGDDDGALGLSDAVALLNALFAGGPPLPPPNPECGIDPSADGLECLQPPC